MKTVGITLGPISQTLSLAKNPAMLWYASSVFSHLAFTVCKNIVCGIDGAKLLVPYIDTTKLQDGVFSEDGIGKYHDRIIFTAENTDNLSDILDKSKREIAEMISFDKNNGKNDADIAFLMQYFQTPYIVLDKKDISGNIILAVSPYLDALEQMRVFSPDNTHNTFAAFFASNNMANSNIKHCKMLENVSSPQLLLKTADNGFRFRDIGSIASGHTKAGNKKTAHYYAVIQADGDNMGKYLETLADDAIPKFSENCIEYATEASKLIESYGGMTIYAGGDDLLALVPLVGKDAKGEEIDIFMLCQAISKVFDEIVKKTDNYPTASIGVAIRHVKFPLYEALKAAEGALFGKAKNMDGKNHVALDFQKHSGQSVKITMPVEQLSFVDSIMKSGDTESVNSVIYILDSLTSMVKTAVEGGAECDKQMIANIFKNFYDNASQKKYGQYIDELADKLYTLASATGRKISVYDCDGVSATKTFEGLLRIKKFLNEEVYHG